MDPETKKLIELIDGMLIILMDLRNESTEFSQSMHLAIQAYSAIKGRPATPTLIKPIDELIPIVIRLRKGASDFADAMTAGVEALCESKNRACEESC